MKRKNRFEKEVTPIYLDKKGYQELLDSIEDLKRRIRDNNRGRRDAYKAEIGEGWASAELEEIERVDNFLFAELHRKHEMLSRVVIVERDEDNNKVNLGDVVRVLICAENEEPEEQLFKIIGGIPDFKLDAEFQEISINSPAGSAIFQKSVGETTSYSVNNMHFFVEIQEIVELSKKQSPKTKKLKK